MRASKHAGVLPPTYPLTYGGGKSQHQPQTVTALSNYDGGAETEWVWYATGNNGSIADETSNFWRGSKSIKMTTGGTGLSCRMEKTIGNNPYLDLSSYAALRVSVWIDDVTTLHATNGFLFALLSSNSDTNSSSFKILPDLLVNGRNDIAVPVNALTTGGTPNLAQVHKIKCSAFSATGKVTNIIWNGLDGISQDNAKGTVIFTFDDGYSSVFSKAVPILAANNWRGVSFPICSAIGVTAGNMTPTEVYQLNKIHRWDVGAHTYAQHVDWTGLTEAQIRTDSEKDWAWKMELGIDPTPVIAYALGKYNATVQKVCSEFFSLGRHAYSSGYSPTETQPFFSPMGMRIGDVSGSVTPATVAGWVDKVAANKGCLVLMFHKIIDSYNVGGIEYLTADFQTIVDHIASHSADVQVKTFSELEGW